MESGFTFAELDLGAGARFVSLRRALGVTSFGMNLMLLEPGQRGRIHRHERQEEVFLVLEGVLTIGLEGQEHDLGVHELVRIAPRVRRQLMNRHPTRCAVLALGGVGEHTKRDGAAFLSWDDMEPREISDVPLPDDLPIRDA